MSVASIEIANHYLRDAPLDAARFLETKKLDEVVLFLEQAPVADCALVLQAMQNTFAGQVLVRMSVERASDVCSLLNMFTLAGFLRMVAKGEREKVLVNLSERRQFACRRLLQFPADTVGALAQVELPTFSEDMTVEACLQRLKKLRYFESPNIYVLNANKQLVGRQAIASLMHEIGSRRLESLDLQKMQSISGRTPIRVALDDRAWDNTDCLAVINSRRIFIGIVQHHQLRAAEIDHATLASENISLLSGFSDAFATSLFATVSMLTKDNS